MKAAWENQDGRSGVQGLVTVGGTEIMCKLESRVGAKMHSPIVKAKIRAT